MVSRAETEISGKLDTFKLIVAAALLIGGIAVFYYFESQSLLYGVLGLLGFVAVSLGVMYTTRVGQGLWAFARESRSELRKVIWPTRQETVQTTLLVLVFVLLMGIMMWLIDMVLRWGVLNITGQGG